MSPFFSSSTYFWLDWVLLQVMRLEWTNQRKKFCVLFIHPTSFGFLWLFVFTLLLRNFIQTSFSIVQGAKVKTGRREFLRDFAEPGAWNYAHRYTNAWFVLMRFFSYKLPSNTINCIKSQYHEKLRMTKKYALNSYCFPEGCFTSSLQEASRTRTVII